MNISRRIFIALMLLAIICGCASVPKYGAIKLILPESTNVVVISCPNNYIDECKCDFDIVDGEFNLQPCHQKTKIKVL